MWSEGDDILLWSAINTSSHWIIKLVSHPSGCWENSGTYENTARTRKFWWQRRNQGTWRISLGRINPRWISTASDHEDSPEALIWIWLLPSTSDSPPLPSLSFSPLPSVVSSFLPLQLFLQSSLALHCMLDASSQVLNALWTHFSAV